jgi:hypothetical protein
MTRQIRKRKCKKCYEYFLPDPHNIKKQRYCSKPDCRKASKAAAQARWLAQKDNRNYFRSPENVMRVQAWRAQHPGYWRKGTKSNNALQDHPPSKTTNNQGVNTELTQVALQDLLITQRAVLAGLIALLTGNTLQDDIATTTRHMQQLGSDILNSSTPDYQGGDYVNKTTNTSRPGP